MSKITDFYLNNGTTVEGLTWEDIMNFDNDDLEECHIHIQWCFPLKEGSSVQPTAPVLTDEDIDILKDNTIFLERYEKGLRKMMKFYGFDERYCYSSSKGIFLDDFHNWDRKVNHWITPMNHNFLRITRIIKSLKSFKQYKLCSEVFRCFSNLYLDYPEYANIIGKVSYKFWEEASDYENDFPLLNKFYDRKSTELNISEKIVFNILADVTDRRGWKQEWDGFDQDIKEEIIEKWINIVNANGN